MTELAPRASDINVTPYIDILLALPIIFMVIQPTRQYDLSTRVPDVLATKPASAAPRVVVTIDQDFKLGVNGQPVAMSELGAKLLEILGPPRPHAFRLGRREPSLRPGRPRH